MIVYIDASVIVAVVGSESRSEAIDRFLRDAEADALVSDFALAESSAALARNGRLARWTSDQADRVYGDLDAWVSMMTKPAEIASADIADAILVVRQNGLSVRAPDAIHIVAARRLDAILLTLDRGMARAATALGVSCIDPSAPLPDRKT